MFPIVKRFSVRIQNRSCYWTLIRVLQMDGFPKDASRSHSSYCIACREAPHSFPLNPLAFLHPLKREGFFKLVKVPLSMEQRKQHTTDMRKNSDINKSIAEAILRAQNCSNGGKDNQYNDCRSYSRKNKRDNFMGYMRKNSMILKAISLINTGKSDFVFSVVVDEEGIMDYIVYFQVKYTERRSIENCIFYDMPVTRQVSFHSSDDRLAKYVGATKKIEWDHHSSNTNAIKIYTHFVPNGMYY